MHFRGVLGGWGSLYVNVEIRLIIHTWSFVMPIFTLGEGALGNYDFEGNRLASAKAIKLDIWQEQSKVAPHIVYVTVHFSIYLQH